MSDHRPPRDNLYRAIFPGAELRQADGDSGPTMAGHFAVFNQWTEINSIFEGRFMERFAPGAFKKTIRDQRNSMRALFQHGMDSRVGDKPLGPIDELREDDTGVYYEVPLLDAAYVRDDVLPGLEAGLYGASFRFRVLREEIEEEPGTSEDNPDGIPQRTVKEAEVREFGPVTFPAYEGATAGVRSLTDEMLIERMANDPERMRQLLGFASNEEANARFFLASAGQDRAETSGQGEDPEAEAPERAEEPEGGAEAEPHPAEGETESEDSAGTESHPDRGQEQSEDSAGAEPHPDRGRDNGTPLYGVPNRTPKWRL